MTFKPKVVESGWYARCLKSAIKLSLQHPLAWLCVYILPMASSQFVQEVPLLMLIAGFVILAGTVLAFKSDSKADTSIRDLVRSVLSATYIFLAAAIAIWMLSWFSLQSPGSGLIPKQDAGLFWGFSLGAMYLVEGVAVLACLLMVIEIISLVLFRADPPFLHAIGLFNLHLTIDMGMEPALAGKCSREAISLNIDKCWVLVPSFAISMLFPPLFGLMIPFIYCLYREIFWGVGLVERKETQVASPHTQIQATNL